jgi:uncharacterized protein
MTIHIAIMRRVKPGKEAAFEQGLREFFQASFSHSGVQGAHMLTPTPGSNSREYGILRSFATTSERDAFYESDAFRMWDERAGDLTEGDAEYKELHGLEAWFRSPGKGSPPSRWKMAIATLIGVYPTSLLLGITVAPLASELPRPLQTMAIAICMVSLLTWIVMPLVTRALHRWLHR